MSKINIEVCLTNQKEKIINIKTQGIIADNKIKYIENNTINILDLEKETLRRSTKEYTLLLDFKNEKALYDYNTYKLPLEIKVINKEIKPNKITIKYKILETNDIYEYKINWR